MSQKNKSTYNSKFVQKSRFGEMRALLSLLLTFNGAQNERIIVRGHAFPCLKEFCLFKSTSRTRPTYVKFEEGAMPKLEKLKVPFVVSVAKAYGFSLGINHLPCLKHAEVILDNREATSSERKAAAAAIRNEANANPNHPRVFISVRGRGREFHENLPI